MPEWGITILVISVIIIFGIAIYVPIMYRIRSAKFKKERTVDRKITVDKPNDRHRHLLLEKSVNRPFYNKYFTNLTNEYEVKTLQTTIVFNLDLFESDYANIIEMLVKASDKKYHPLIAYLIDTNLNLLITNIFSEITNHFIIPNLEALNEQWEIINDVSDEYYTQWILDFRQRTINFICNTYLPIVYQNILELIKTKDVIKYTDEIQTIISTKYQTIIFNSLEKNLSV
ncbi:hypothetical protein [Spiroplasma sp. SV19]|uniref:hypothetical protein n=1 Tax=Spiroplasma sp. SV19 TaxID=2570468 RepID=UPI0024B804BA|nr:hypothetical protein [Spiroplasma sp. SV19]WHQ37167.1 hypothetical protein E7Y35_04665 [Spiroplasma sp. SV19]